MMTYDEMFIKSVIVIKVLNKNKSFMFCVVRHLGAYMQRNSFFEIRKIITVCLLL